MTSTRHPTLRLALFSLGIGLVIASPLVGIVPGPGGIVVFAGGLALMLQNSHWAKKRFANAKRRWPRFGHYADIGLRRASSRRRRDRAASAEQAGRSENAAAPPAPHVEDTQKI